MNRGVIEPAQARSRRTHERILGAAETLLRTRDFEQIRVQDIAARAGVSVGTFYGRFESKQAMIPALYQRYDERLGAVIDREGSRLAAQPTLSRAVECLVDLTLEHYERERGLLRLIAMPGSVRPPRGRMQANGARLLEHIYGVLGRFAAAMPHHDPRPAIAFGVYSMYATARDWVLHPKAPQMTPLPRDRDVIRALLARQLLALLAAPTGQGT